MKIYFAGAESFMDVLINNGVKNILVSYWSMSKRKEIPDLSAFENIFLDSGGFSARNSGAEISVALYSAFIKRHGFKTYANLDLKETEDTLLNQKFLEAIGLNPIPVYHMDEWLEKKESLLDDYIAKYPYIAVGGVAGVRNTANLIDKYLSFVFSKTQNKVKVHGFGMTALRIIKKYPFYSVDSTNWLNGGKFNDVVRFRNGKILSTNVYKPLHSKIRNGKNIREILKIEKFVTDLWKERGVVWND